MHTQGGPADYISRIWSASMYIGSRILKWEYLFLKQPDKGRLSEEKQQTIARKVRKVKKIKRAKQDMALVIDREYALSGKGSSLPEVNQREVCTTTNNFDITNHTKIDPDEYN